MGEGGTQLDRDQAVIGGVQGIGHTEDFVGAGIFSPLFYFGHVRGREFAGGGQFGKGQSSGRACLPHLEAKDDVD